MIKKQYLLIGLVTITAALQASYPDGQDCSGTAQEQYDDNLWRLGEPQREANRQILRSLVGMGYAHVKGYHPREKTIHLSCGTQIGHFESGTLNTKLFSALVTHNHHVSGLNQGDASVPHELSVCAGGDLKCQFASKVCEAVMMTCPPATAACRSIGVFCRLGIGPCHAAQRACAVVQAGCGAAMGVCKASGAYAPGGKK